MTSLFPEYKLDYSSHYKLLPCYENFTLTGPDAGAQQASPDDESDDEPADCDDATEDHYALLVKAWEQKVFPTIRRRFRNEAERKDGLEQIRGALQLGRFGDGSDLILSYLIDGPISTVTHLGMNNMAEILDIFL